SYSVAVDTLRQAPACDVITGALSTAARPRHARDCACIRFARKLSAPGPGSGRDPANSLCSARMEAWHMDVLINFFALRPTFTFAGLQIVWYLYLLNTLIQSYFAIGTAFQALAQRGVSWTAAAPSLGFALLAVVVQLILVRLLLEVAAIIISNARSPR